MLLFTRILIALAAASALPVTANAGQTEFQLTGVVTFPTSAGSGITNTNGQSFTLDVFANNGNSSLANQTWNSANVTEITLSIGSTFQATYTASQYGGPAYAYGTPGSTWKTDASGVLQAASQTWVGTGNSSKGPFTAFAVSETQTENGVVSSNGDTARTGTNDTQFITGVQGSFIQVYDLAGNHDNLAYSPSAWTIVSTAAVPEPGTYALMAGGLMGIAALARRRNKPA